MKMLPIGSAVFSDRSAPRIFLMLFSRTVGGLPDLGPSCRPPGPRLLNLSIHSLTHLDVTPNTSATWETGSPSLSTARTASILTRALRSFSAPIASSSSSSLSIGLVIRMINKLCCPINLCGNYFGASLWARTLLLEKILKLTLGRQTLEITYFEQSLIFGE